MLPSAGEMPAEIKHFVLLKSKEPAMDPMWPGIQEIGCDVYASVPPANQRFLQEKLDLPRMMKEYKLTMGRNSSSMRYLTNIAKQLSPFLSHTCIYTANRVSVISLLGAELDRLVLDQLPMPYKISERSLNPDENFLVETLLEPNKPFVLLVRDFWPEGAWPENSLWQLQFKEDLETIGIKIIHSWSNGWLLEPNDEVDRIKDEILHFVGSTFTGMQMV